MYHLQLINILSVKPKQSLGSFCSNQSLSLTGNICFREPPQTHFWSSVGEAGLAQTSVTDLTVHVRYGLWDHLILCGWQSSALSPISILFRYWDLNVSFCLSLFVFVYLSICLCVCSSLCLCMWLCMLLSACCHVAISACLESESRVCFWKGAVKRVITT